MFRFVALSWQIFDQGAAAAAARLSEQFREPSVWSTAISRSGLHVFVTGARRGANRVCVLGDQRSVVVGKLFRRSAATAPSDDLDNGESARILQSKGRALIDDFWGRYVAFLADAGTGTSVLRDPGGTLPCHFLRHERVTIAFSWLEDVLAAVPGLQRLRVNDAALAAHLAHGELQGAETALCGVRRVLAGEMVHLDQDPAQPRLLWDPLAHARAASDMNTGHAMEVLHDTVHACTTAWASCYDTLLLRLSGGLDSSILAACLARSKSTIDVTCVNYHSPGTDSDERSYARLVASRAQLELVERERDSGFALQTVLTAARTPTPTNYLGRMGSARMDAELAASHGATAMFTGGGGDQLF